jgi:hypothetical protein
MGVEVLEVAGPKGYPIAEEIDDVVPVVVVVHPMAERRDYVQICAVPR